jgi:anaerobic magnesium-protoporphyrin IX monomethyl ester cyclase
VLKSHSRKVVLFLPPYAGPVLGPPLGLLGLAAAIRQAGFEPRIIDGALDRDFRRVVLREAEECLCFGVSLLTGPMILAGIEMSRAVRALRPDLMILYGGWHPTLVSAQTLEESSVDAVVRHQGEKTLVEILERLTSGQSLDMVAGCWFKRDGRIVMNPDRSQTALSELPIPAYDLVDFDAYERAGGVRKLPYATSIGCPYACNYCTDMVFYNRRFNPYDTEHVVSELTDLVQRHRLTEVALVDSNFLVDVRRALGIAEGILRRGTRFRWTFQASTDLLCRMSDEHVKTMARSGVSHIGFGTESGSTDVLRMMNKRHEHIRDMYEAARKCKEAGIRVTYNLIFGYPGEEERHRRETLRVMTDIAARFDNVSFSPNIFTPYPGIPVWPQLRSLGLQEPGTLAAWADVDLGSTRLPWLQGKPYQRLQRSVSYFLLDNQINKKRRKARSPLLRSLWRLVRKPVYWRLKHFRFDYPLELWLGVAQQWLTVRRSLLTGQPLSRELAKAR